MTSEKIKANGWALIPILVFLIIYLFSSIIAGDFYKMPLNVSFLTAAFAALAMNRKRTLEEKLDSFMSGMGNKNIMMMCFIFILAGAFAQTAREMGAVETTVNLGLNLLPGNILLAGIFLISCFISLSVGTSLGTVVALAPMALGFSESLHLSDAVTLGAVLGGSMFGDNLSMISDTTIAAARTQGCHMRDKFKVNFFIVLPAAIVTLIIYTFYHVGTPDTSALVQDLNYFKVIPYLFVLIAALSGMNVMIVLFLGTILAGAIGMITVDTFTGWTYAKAMGNGIMGMSEIIIISMLVGGIVEIIRINGGIEFLLQLIGKKSKSKRGAEFGIAMLTSIVNIFTANNTIAILMAGPITKDISAEFKIPARRSASIMDTFSCFVQGMLPYGAQILAAVGIAGVERVNPIELMQALYYPYLMGIVAILSIVTGWPGKKIVGEVK